MDRRNFLKGVSGVVVTALIIGADGPAVASAISGGGKKYIYKTYALGIADVDRTTAEFALWPAMKNTVDGLLAQSKIPDPMVLWRQRPLFEEDKDFASQSSKFKITMRCVVVPRSVADSIARPL